MGFRGRLQGTRIPAIDESRDLSTRVGSSALSPPVASAALLCHWPERMVRQGDPENGSKGNPLKKARVLIGPWIGDRGGGCLLQGQCGQTGGKQNPGHIMGPDRCSELVNVCAPLALLPLIVVEKACMFCQHTRPLKVT